MESDGRALIQELAILQGGGPDLMQQAHLDGRLRARAPGEEGVVPAEKQVPEQLLILLLAELLHRLGILRRSGSVPVDERDDRHFRRGVLAGVAADLE